MEFRMLWAKVVTIAMFLFGVFLMGVVPACCTFDTNRDVFRTNTKIAGDTNLTRLYSNMAESAVAFLRDGRVVCTGNIVSAQKTHAIVTSVSHCVPDNARYVSLLLRNGKHVRAFVVGTNVRRDIAVLIMPPVKIAATPKFCGSPKEYTKVFAIGHPAMLKWIPLWGYIASLGNKKDGQNRFYTVAMAAFFGASGALVVDSNMCVVGIFARVWLIERAGNTHVLPYSFVIPYEDVASYLIYLRPEIQTAVNLYFSN